MSNPPPYEGNDIGPLTYLIADNSPAMVSYWDAGLVCRFANAAYLHWFGKLWEDVVGKMTLPEFLGPRYQQTKPYIDAALLGKVQHLERLLPAREGEEARYAVINFVPNMEGGMLKGFVMEAEIVKAQPVGTTPLRNVNLHRYVLKVIAALQQEVLTSHANIHNYVNPLRHIEANPTYMESIIYNLLSNSIKYRHPGRHPFIEISSLAVGNETVLTIKDNGIGIDLEKHRPNLYDMYRPFHENEDGGIGLFMTKYQVDRMGGYIGVESRIDEGTEFRVYFKTNAEI